MTKTKSLLILIFTLLFSNYYLSSFPEEISITTYYPSPVGIYKELRAKRMAIGDSFYNSSHYCWEGSCTVSVDSDADLVVEGKVGIGTTDPEKELHVAGDAEIEGGVVIGNPTGGNKGTGTINAEKIYVNGSEVGGCRIVTGFNQYNMFGQCHLSFCSWEECRDGVSGCRSPCSPEESLVAVHVSSSTCTTEGCAGAHLCSGSLSSGWNFPRGLRCRWCVSSVCCSSCCLPVDKALCCR